MPVTRAKRLEPSREKKSTREDKRHEMKKPLSAKPRAATSAVVSSALRRRGH